MLKVPYQNIGFPVVHYKNQTTRPMSRWKIPPNTQFLGTSRLASFTFGVIGSSNVHNESPRYYADLLKKHLARCGFTPNQVRDFSPPNGQALVPLDRLEEYMQKLKNMGAKVVILVIASFNREWYRKFKNLADRTVGIQSICLVERMKGTDNFFDQYMQNVSMKINLKSGGINHTALPAQERDGGVMVLGADLIHAATGTIAAVVGSVDPTLGKYLGCVRLQPIQDSNGPVSDREVSRICIPADMN